MFLYMENSKKTPDLGACTSERMGGTFCETKNIHHADFSVQT